jgi:hypothetical protein
MTPQHAEELAYWFMKHYYTIKKPDPETVTMLVHMLKKLDYDASKQTLNALIMEETTCPNLAVIAQKLNGVVPERIKATEIAECNFCFNSGQVYAKRDGYEYAFGCTMCQRYPGLPQWSTERLKQGYKLSFVPKFKPEVKAKAEELRKAGKVTEYVHYLQSLIDKDLYM